MEGAVDTLYDGRIQADEGILDHKSRMEAVVGIFDNRYGWMEDVVDTLYKGRIQAVEGILDHDSRMEAFVGIFDS